MKRCSKCGIEKSLIDYHIDKRRIDMWATNREICGIFYEGNLNRKKKDIIYETL